MSPTGDPAAIPPFTLRFSNTACDGHAVLAGDEDGILTVLDTRRSLRDQMRVLSPSHAPPARFRAHDNAIFDAVWMAGDSRIVSASGDASIRVFDPETLFRTALCRGARQSVKCVRAVNPSASAFLLVSSGRDGAIRLHDLRVRSVFDPSQCRDLFHKPVYEIQRAHTPASAATPTPSKRRRISAPPPCASVTSVAVVPGSETQVFSAGAADGAIKLWDIRASCTAASKGRVDVQCVESVTPSDEPRHGAAHAGRRRHGIASLDIDASGTKLLASSTDSSIYLYDAQQLGLGHSQLLAGHTANSFYIRAAFSPCGRFVASGSGDTAGYIWDLEGERYTAESGCVQPIVRLCGHRGGDVSVVEWSNADPFTLVTCGDDTTVKVWRANAALGERSSDEGYGIGQEVVDERAVREQGQRGRSGVGRSSGSEQEEGRRSRRRPVSAKRALRDSDIRTFFGNKLAAGECSKVLVQRQKGRPSKSEAR